MKKILILIGLAATIFGCQTKDNFNDMGISNGIHACTMYEYLARDSYNFDTTRLVIERAGLTDLFRGTDPAMSQITFFAPTNHSFLRYMLTKGYKRVTDMSPAQCRALILLHVVKKRFLKEDIAFRTPMATGGYAGGSRFTTVGGVNLYAYKEQLPWGGVENAGAVTLYLRSETSQKKIPLASPDIQTNTGVVHSLNYNYTVGDMITAAALTEIEKL